MMSETSDGKTEPILSSTQEKKWLEKAVKHLENGMNITVNYLGKIELAKSLSEEPDPDKRIDVVVGLLRVIAKEATVLQDPVIPDVTSSFLLNSKIRAKPPRLAALSISVKGFGLALVDSSASAPILSWHSVSEVAFAHVDPEHENIVGYYAAKKSTGKRFCYAIETKSAAHILACIKLAFTMVEQQKTGKMNLRTVAEAMTPSPTTPSKGGAYSLIRFATPDDQSNRPSSSRTAVSKHFKEDDDDLTNIYLNVMLPAPPMNPYHVHHIYRGISNFFGANENKKSIIQEKIIEQSPTRSEEEQIRQAPPIMKKSEKLRKTMEERKLKSQENQNLSELNNQSKNKKIAKNFIYSEVYFGSPETKTETEKPEPPKYSKLMPQPSLQSPHQKPPKLRPKPLPRLQPEASSKPPQPVSKPPTEPQLQSPPPPPPSAKSKIKPIINPQARRVDMRTALTDPDRELESPVAENPDLTLRRERQKILEHCRFEYIAKSREIPAALQPQKRRVFKELKNKLKQRSLRILRKKMGNLRPKDEDEGNMSLKSEYSSLNSGSFYGSISEVSEDDSLDSGVMDVDFFVFPEQDLVKPEFFCLPKSQRPYFQLEFSLERFLKLAEYLDEQPWFHGTIKRQIAECRLVKDGEFLIRQSSTQPGQFILSVLQNKTVRHICLVDANGKIRSHGNEFGSVIQLIQYHFQFRVPICSKHTAVLLETPVARP